MVDRNRSDRSEMHFEEKPGDDSHAVNVNVTVDENQCVSLASNRVKRPRPTQRREKSMPSLLLNRRTGYHNTGALKGKRQAVHKRAKTRQCKRSYQFFTAEDIEEDVNGMVMLPWTSSCVPVCCVVLLC